MATDVDSLRSTLDSLRLSADAKADRPYLVSMLRRLGYSEADIAAYFGSQQAPTPRLAEDTDERLIEIEYTGPGLRDFSFVEPVDASELETSGLGAGLTAGDEVIAGGPSMEEVDRMMEEQGLSDFGDTGFVQEAQEEVKMTEGIGLEDSPAEEGAEGEGGTPGEGGEAGKDEGEVAFSEDPYKLGEGMVEFSAVELNPGISQKLPDPTQEGWEPVDPNAAPEPEQSSEAPGGWDVAEGSAEGEGLEEAQPWPEEGELEPAPELPEQDGGQGFGEDAFEGQAEIAPLEGQGDDDGAQWAAADEATPQGFQYKDWTLYSKEQLGPNGEPQRIYFFSRGEATDAEASQLPPGYEVSENERTGLPYLRRIGEDEWSDAGGIDTVGGDIQRGKKKRVRVKRVRAASREEAEGKVSSEGGNPIATMPIDIEERWDQ